MKRVLSFCAALLLAATSAHAQTTTPLETGHGGSAHVRTSWKLNGANVSLEYGRPSLKGRAESQMMPAGKPWRTGADAATLLTTDSPLKFGNLVLKPGSYTINTVPGDKSWELVFGRLAKAGQWGVPYQPALEIGRVGLSLSHTSAPVEQVTFSIDSAASGHVLRLDWGTTRVSVPFTIVK